jgi:hypothetical protein
LRTRIADTESGERREESGGFNTKETKGTKGGMGQMGQRGLIADGRWQMADGI